MPSPVLTTLADLKIFLGINADETGEDSRLTAILLGVEQTVQKYLGRSLPSASYTHYFDGPGRETLFLKQRPLTAVSTVRIDASGYGGHGADAFPSESAQTLGVDFFPTSLEENESNPGTLIAIGGYWPVGKGNIKVTYTAGYQTIPPEIVNAVHIICSEQFDMAGKGGKVKGETLGDYSYTLAIGKELEGGDSQFATARAMLGAFRDIRF